MKKQYLSHSEAETEAFAAQLAENITPGTVIAYAGGLGTGKTVFTRGLARGLGYTGRVTSPTFTIVNEYVTGRLPLFHFDLYRLHSEEDLWDIGWEEYIERGGVCAVEWSERAGNALPDYTLYIRFSQIAETTERVIEIEWDAPGQNLDFGFLQNCKKQDESMSTTNHPRVIGLPLPGSANATEVAPSLSPKTSGTASGRID